MKAKKDSMHSYMLAQSWIKFNVSARKLSIDAQLCYDGSHLWTKYTKGVKAVVINNY